MHHYEVPCNICGKFQKRETHVQYAKQFLAEEKRLDKKTRKVSWQQIKGRANHLLDCEIYAVACADSSWTLSIRYLAKNEK